MHVASKRCIFGISAAHLARMASIDSCMHAPCALATAVCYHSAAMHASDETSNRQAPTDRIKVAGSQNSCMKSTGSMTFGGSPSILARSGQVQIDLCLPGLCSDQNGFMNGLLLPMIQDVRQAMRSSCPAQ